MHTHTHSHTHLYIFLHIHKLLFKGLGSVSLSLRRHAHGPLAKRLMHMVHLSGTTLGLSKSSSVWLNPLV